VSLLSYFRQLARLVRIPNSFTVVANVLAAYIVGASATVDISALVTLVSISLCFYHAGIVHNDCVDIDEDIRTQPQRPLACGAIPLSFAWMLACYLFIFGLLLTLSFDKQTIFVAITLVVCILAYNFSSRIGMLGCVMMGFCRGLNWLMVLAAVGAAKEHAQFAYITGTYVVALTLLSRDANYAQKRWLLVLCIAALLSGSAIFLWFLPVDTKSYGIKVAIFLTGLTFVFCRISFLYRHYTVKNIRATVALLILGMIPLDACLVFIAGYPFWSVLVLLLLIPGKLLTKKLYLT